MKRCLSPYMIIKIDNRLVPSTIEYYAHDDQGRSRWANYRESATRYDSDGEAISKAKELRGIYPCQFRVVSCPMLTTSYDSARD
jgi:hypothetical protein